MFAKIALKSLLDRKGSMLLTVVAMTISVFVFLSVEHIRHQTKKSFDNTLSGVDLIVGARSGSLNLLLYSVFRIGSPVKNITWESYKKIASNANVSWTIPISLGDSHKGFPVLGTNDFYFSHFKYGENKQLEFTAGNPFTKLFDVVIGSEISEQLKYKIGEAHIDLNKMSINVKDNNKKINNTEKKVLIEMLSNPGKTFSREEIGKISGINQERSIDVMITRLRQKIEIDPKNPKYLQTIRGEGYVLWIE